MRHHYIRGSSTAEGTLCAMDSTQAKLPHSATLPITAVKLEERSVDLLQLKWRQIPQTQHNDLHKAAIEGHTHTHQSPVNDSNCTGQQSAITFDPPQAQWRRGYGAQNPLGSSSQSVGMRQGAIPTVACEHGQAQRNVQV